MDLHDKRKPGGAVPRQNDADGKRKPVIRRDDDLLDDVEFDLLEETEEAASNDFFSRDTAIPASPPEQLAAEAMRQVDAVEKSRSKSKPAKPRGKPKLPPPPIRTKPRTPITLDPPPEELDFDSFDDPIDVFGNHLPGAPQVEPKPRHPFADPEPKPRHPFAETEPQQRHPFAHSELPTAPPAAPKGMPAQAKRTSPAPERATRNAFLAETKRNRPIDPEMLARARPPGSSSSNGRPARPAMDSGLDFEELDPLLDSLTPMPSSKPPAPPSSTTARAGAKELEQCYALGDYNRALKIAEEILARSPDDLSARRYAQNCRDALTQMFAARIGPLDQVMSVVVSPEEVQWLSLDHRAGFLLSLVDGQSTVDEILDISGMTRLDALKIIHDLAEQQVVRLG
jgi:hypothetical protein